jgi:hypothetical protein
VTREPNYFSRIRRADSGAVEVGHVASDARIHGSTAWDDVVEAERVSQVHAVRSSAR